MSIGSASSHSPNHHSLLCRICGDPVPVTTAKTDSEGKAIHEECYALKLKFEQAQSRGSSEVQHARGRGIAAAFSTEQNPEKSTKLVADLNQVLDEKNFDGTAKIKPAATTKPEKK